MCFKTWYELREGEQRELEWNSIPTRILVVGEKGSGKSTVIQKYQIFRECKSNQIYEIDIENFRADKWFHSGDQKTYMLFGMSNLINIKLRKKFAFFTF